MDAQKSVLDLIFEYPTLVPRMMRQLPCMRDVVSLALTSKFFLCRLRRFIPSTESHWGQETIFTHILIQSLYRTHPSFNCVLSLKDAQLGKESERTCLIRNYLTYISPRVALDLDSLLSRFQREYGAPFKRLMSYKNARLAACIPFANPSSSLLRLRAEFCMSINLFKLFASAKTPYEYLSMMSLVTKEKAAEISNTSRKIAELSKSLETLRIANDLQALEPYDSTALLGTFRCNSGKQSTRPDQDLLRFPITYNPWKDKLETRCVPRRGLFLLPASAINLQHS